MVYSGDILLCLVSADAVTPSSPGIGHLGVRHLLGVGWGGCMHFVNKRTTSPGSEQRTPGHLQTVRSSLGEAMPASSNGGYVLLFPSYEQLKVSSGHIRFPSGDLFL